MTNNPGRMISIVVAVVIGAGIVFFGLQQFNQWHEEKVQSAVEKEQERYARQTAALIEQLERLEQEVAENEPADIPEERIAQVFGEPVAEDPIEMASGEINCADLQQKIRSFFQYLDEKGVYASGDAEDTGGTYAVFNGMLADLSDNPPVVVGETRDMISLLHNQAHFFRTLDKERLELLLGILKTEKDVLEPALSVFYEYYTCDECTTARADAPIDLSALYEYAGFFLNTLSGKSYIMRRDSAFGSLARYYSVMVLDRANDEGANEYGLDIRPHIALTLDDIRNQQNLQFKDEYVQNLEDLSEKYRIQPAVQAAGVD